MTLSACYLNVFEDGLWSLRVVSNLVLVIFKRMRVYCVMSWSVESSRSSVLTETTIVFIGKLRQGGKIVAFCSSIRSLTKE